MFSSCSYTNSAPSKIASFIISQSIGNVTFQKKRLHSSFTGKEKDSETGYYAFGARYYDCDLSGIFLSVDPMSDKYPSISPYAYCAWNPVKLVDPDGESPIPTAIKLAKRIYKIYKKTGKITPAALKKAGLGEIADIAGDIHTVFSSDASLLDRLAAVADLIVGTNLNKKGNKAALDEVGVIISNKKTRRTRDSSASEKHGDNGRALSKAGRQIEDLKKQKEGASRREKERINRKIQNIQHDAQRKQKGEEHSRGIKK